MNESPALHNHVQPWRIWIFALVLLLVLGWYVARLFTLQILQGPTWSAQASDNSSRQINIAAQRGVIYDRNGVVLARNIASYNVVITAAGLPDDPGEVQEIFRQLSELLKIPINKGEISDANPYVPCVSDHGIAQIVEYGEASTPFQPVQVKCDIDRTTAMVIQEKSADWPGVGVEIIPVRDYPTGVLTASFIGFLGPIPANRADEFIAAGLDPNRDKVGYAGLELEYQDLLAGRNGQRLAEVDVAGKEIRTVGEIQSPVSGLNLRLTIDTRFQAAATAIVQREINFWNTYFGEIRSTSGVAIAINPQTGEILAMVSYPSYENNRMARLIPSYYYNQLVNDPTIPLLNHAVGDTLPAGSVFKLSTAVGALNEGVVTPEQVLETPPKIIINETFSPNEPGRPREFVDWNKAGFGHLDFLG